MSMEIILIVLLLLLFKENPNANHNQFYTGGVAYKPKPQKPKSSTEVREKFRPK